MSEKITMADIAEIDRVGKSTILHYLYAHNYETIIQNNE